MGDTMFALFYSAGPNWIPGKPLRDQPFWPHNQHLKSLLESGQLAFAGVSADSDEFLGVVFLCVKSKEAAQEILERDPAIKSGLFKAVLRPWLTVFERDRGGAATPDSR